MADVTINGKQVSALTMNGNIVYSRYFKPLEYIESSGTQYIDTGLTINTTFKYRYAFMGIECEDASFGFGAIQQANTNYHRFQFISNPTNQNVAQLCWNSSTSVYNVKASAVLGTNKRIMVLNPRQKTGTIDGTNLAYEASAGFTTDATGSITLHLFRRNSNTDSLIRYPSVRLYYFKVLDGADRTLRNFYPCRLTSAITDPSLSADGNAHARGEVGMWDTVTNKFYANLGTGTFIASDDTYTVKKYIESSGTQYIDTGYYPNSKTKNTVKFQYTSLTSPSANASVAGCYVTTDSTCTNYIYLNNGNFGVGSGSSNKQVSCGTADLNVHTVTTDFVAKTVTFDSGTAQACNGITTTFNRQFALFTMCKSNGDFTTFLSKSRIYYAQCYNNGVLARNLIPCQLNRAITASEDSAGTARASGTIGMWDTVSNKFFANAGTGTFTAG